MADSGGQHAKALNPMIGRLLCGLGLHRLTAWGTEAVAPHTQVVSRACRRPECGYAEKYTVFRMGEIAFRVVNEEDGDRFEPLPPPERDRLTNSNWADFYPPPV